MPRDVYLDNNTAAQPSDKAISASMPFVTQSWGVPSASHRFGQAVVPAIKQAYEAIYAVVNASKDATFIFTASGAEAANHVVSSVYYDVTRMSGKNHYVVGATDEAPAMMAMSRYEQFGCVTRLATACRQGTITKEAVAEALTPRTALVSLSWVNGLTGVVNPIAEIGELLKERGVLFHVDATHALGKLWIDFADAHVDYLTFNGDQIHAPRGTGGLFIDAGQTLSPFILGGTEQNGLRAGTMNVPGLVGLGVACEELVETMDLMGTEVARLRSRFENEVCLACDGARVLFVESERVPNTTVISFPGVIGEALSYVLSQEGIYASIGGGTFQQLRMNLRSCGAPVTIADTAVSFALSRSTTEAEVTYAVKTVAEAYRRLRLVSNEFFAPNHRSSEVAP